MPDHTHTLTPAEMARIKADIARVAAERADARIMGAKYDGACEQIVALEDETARQRRRIAELEAQLAATTNPDRAEERLAADARPGVTIYDQGGAPIAQYAHPDDARPTTTCGCGHPHTAHWGESASGRTECMAGDRCPCGGADVPRGPRSPEALAADARPID